MKLHINTNTNDIKVGIQMTATRTYGNKVYGYYLIRYSAPVIEGEGYEIRPNAFGNGISIFVNGREVKTIVSGHKKIAEGKVTLEFDSKEQATEAVEKMRQNKEVFVQMFRNKKVDLAAIKAMVR